MTKLEFQWTGTGPANLKNIFDGCVLVLASPHSTGGISLVLKGERPAHQTTRHLVGRNSPKGEIVADVEDGQLVSFQALDLLAWMTANKFVATSLPARAKESP